MITNTKLWRDYLGVTFLIALSSLSLSSCVDDSLEFKLPEDPITKPVTYAEGKYLTSIISDDESLTVNFSYDLDGRLSELRTNDDLITFDYDPFKVMNGSQDLTSAIHHGLFTDFGTWGQPNGSLYSYSHQTIYDKTTHEYIQNAYFDNDIYKFYWSELNIERVVRRKIVDGKAQIITYIIEYHNKPNRNLTFPAAFAVLDIVPFRYSNPFFIMTGYMGDGPDNLPKQVFVQTTAEDGTSINNYIVKIDYKFHKSGLIDTETITNGNPLTPIDLHLKYHYE